jgi:hypothetical protein
MLASLDVGVVDYNKVGSLILGDHKLASQGAKDNKKAKWKLIEGNTFIVTKRTAVKRNFIICCVKNNNRFSNL